MPKTSSNKSEQVKYGFGIIYKSLLYMICVYKKALFITNAFEVHIIYKQKIKQTQVTSPTLRAVCCRQNYSNWAVHPYLHILKMYTIHTYSYICMCNLIYKLLVEPCPKPSPEPCPLLCTFSTNLAIEVLLFSSCNTGRDRFGLGSVFFFRPRMDPDLKL